MEAASIRPLAAPVPAAIRAAALPACAAVVGAAVVFVIVIAAAGGVPGGAAWAAAAGACAGASGLLLATPRRAAPAAALGVAALMALVVAPTGGGRGEVATARESALRAPAERSRGDAASGRTAMPAERSRGDALSARAAEPVERSRGDAPSTRAAEAPERSRGDVAVALPAEAEAVVRDYYAALDAGRFEAAWGRLAPAVRASFGDFAAWREGYGTTAGHRVEDVVVDRTVDSVTVRHVLVATDRTACGATDQRFAVEWQLERAGDDWRATRLTARKLAGSDPSAAC